MTFSEELEAARSIRERMAYQVLLAATALDHIRPGWAKRISEPLQMWSSRRCVLGQVFRRRWYEFWLVESPFVRGLDAMKKAGYVNGGVFSNPAYTDLWRKQIAQRV